MLNRQLRVMVMMEKHFFLGNGFSLAVFEDVPSWDELLSPDDKAIKNYSIRYEIGLHNENEEENKYKEMYILLVLVCHIVKLIFGGY